MIGFFAFFFLSSKSSFFAFSSRQSSLWCNFYCMVNSGMLFPSRCRVTDTDICVAKYATKCIGKIGARHKAAAARCIDLLLTFLELDLDHIAASIFESIKGISSSVFNNCSQVFFGFNVFIK